MHNAAEQSRGAIDLRDHDAILASAYAIAEPDVVVDPVDGEVIIINLDTGMYFRAQGHGALAWSCVVSGALLRDQPSAAHPGLAAFVADLLGHELIRPVPATTDGVATQLDGDLVLEAYADLKDLLNLDPVHESDPAAGWPTAAR